MDAKSSRKANQGRKGRPKHVARRTGSSCRDCAYTVSVIERGIKVPRLDTFVAIANVLEVSADSLLVDVVEHSTDSIASELSAAIADLPPEEKRRVLKVVSVLVEK